MDYSYYKTDGKPKKLNIKVGQSWNSQRTTNKLLNTLFGMIDNGDGIASESEYQQLSVLLSKADSLIKGSANNKIVDSKELYKLLSEIKNGNIDINDFKSSLPIKVNLSEYKLDNIKSRYPEDKYSICGNPMLGGVVITNKKTKEKIHISGINGKFGVDITETDKNGVKKCEMHYDSSGVLGLGGRNGIPEFPVLSTLRGDLFAKSNVDIKKLEQHVQLITPENVVTVLGFFKDHYNADLTDIIDRRLGICIRSETRAIRSKMINHINKCYEQAYGYRKNFTKNNSQVKNKYYTGDNYKIVCKNDILTVTNKNTGKSRTINLNELTSDFVGRDPIQLKGHIQNLPGEVIMDLADECDTIWDGQAFLTKITTKLNKSEDSEAYYDRDFDDITLHVQKANPNTTYGLVHELGHALDNTLSGESNYYNSELREFQVIFNKVIKRYKAKGKKTYSEKNPNAPYFTAAPAEGFAECYNALTTGENFSEIESNAPELLEATAKLMKKIRSMPQHKRHIPQ